MTNNRCAKLMILLMCFAPLLSHADLAWILNPAGKPGRGIVEVIGDPNTGRWTTPAIDHEKHKALTVVKTYNPESNAVETLVDYNGNNCNEDQSLCLALYYFKSTRGDMDFSGYSKLVFDIKVLEEPSAAVLLRIGSYPTRSEFDIRPNLPSVNDGWQTITITKQEFLDHVYEAFSFERVADPFSITTAGTIKYIVRNIRWEN